MSSNAIRSESPAPVAGGPWPRRLELACFVLLACVWLATLATGLGWPGTLVRVLSWLALLAGALTAAWRGAAPRWLDGPRLLLVALALWSFGAVYTRIGGDGLEYYVPLRSVLLDHDLDLENDFAGLGTHRSTTREGEATTRFPIGLPLLWVPHFAVAHAMALLAALCGSRAAPDGFAPIYHLAMTRGSFLIGLSGLLLLEALLRRLHGRGVALLTTVGIWLATPLHFYMEANPTMSHAASAAAAVCLVASWQRARARCDLRAWLLVGACGGMLALVRLYDGVLLAMPVLDLLIRERRRALRPLAVLVVGPAVAAMLQSLFWLALYGPGFLGIVLRQSGAARIAPHMIDVLFAARHGLFTWTPLYLVAALGWILLVRRDRLFGLLVVLGFTLGLTLTSATVDWWASDSFGQRRLLGMTPLLALGLAEALAFARRRPLVPLAALIVAASLWNLQFEYVFNSQTVADRTQAVTLDRLAAAQADAAFHDLLRAERLLPARVFVLLYDNLRGVWLDEGSRGLDGFVDVGSERPDFPIVIARQWYGPERDGELTFRLPRGRQAGLRIPIRTVGDLDLTLRARRLFAELPVSATVTVNGVVVGEAPLDIAWADRSFSVPGSALRSGFNEVMLGFSAAPRADLAGYRGKNAAAAVDWLRFVRRGPSPDAMPSLR